MGKTTTHDGWTHDDERKNDGKHEQRRHDDDVLHETRRKNRNARTQTQIPEEKTGNAKI